MARYNDEKINQLEKEGKLTALHLFEVNDTRTDTEPQLMPGNQVERCIVDPDFEVKYIGEAEGKGKKAKADTEAKGK